MIRVTKSVEVEVKMSADEVYEEMNTKDTQEMALLLISNGELNIVDILRQVYSDNKPKLYKEIAHHIGVSETEFLDVLIEDLSYWRGK